MFKPFELLKRRFGHWTPRYVFNRFRVLMDEWIHPTQPWLTREAIVILDRLLQEKSRGLGIEFGAGRSTAWFGTRIERMISIESDPVWFENVHRTLVKRGIVNVDLRLVEMEESSYLSALDSLGDGTVDFVLVDGIFRDVCAKRAVPKLKRGAVLVIDNANWFFPSNSQSPNSRKNDFESEVWEKFFTEDIRNWEKIWTSNGVTDTLICIKP